MIELAVGKGEVSIWKNGEFLRESKPSGESMSSEDVLIHIRSLLQDEKSSIAAVKEIICSTGPGGYTGIRVGIATVKGLQKAAGLEAYGYSTIDALLLGAADSSRAVLEAGRKEYLVGDLRSFRIIKHFELPALIVEQRIECVVGAVGDPGKLESLIKTTNATFVNASDNVNKLLYELHVERKGEGSSLSPIYGRSFPAGSAK